MALIWPLACVGADVSLQTSLLCKGMGAELALKWSLACVGAQVTFQCGIDCKAHGAQMALKWPLACVDSDVFFQIRWRRSLIVTGVAEVAASLM